ncbi:hypothetical protein [Streptococcus gallolyticus]|jgi:hypothetical protein
MTVRELIEKLQEFDEWNEVGLRLENVCVLDVLAEADKNGCTFFINDSEIEVDKVAPGVIVITAEGI